jgi:serine/threonine-protein kinase
VSPDRRVLAYRILAQALELPAGGRERFLMDQCRGDDALRREIDGMLSIAVDAGPATVSLRESTLVAEESLVGRTVGRFRLIERIGAGGMGVVYRAERTDGVLQSVAVKLVSNALGAASLQRFEREAQMLARLEHPAIARLIDAGIKDERAWIAIEFVRGERIDAYCRSHGLALREIVQLLILLADAVAAAHSMLVVHSDIKPANVLIGPDGAPKLVDFGIATALREVETGQSLATNDIGPFSPNYAAPEQLSGAPVTVATDVFGLGALSFRLLCGSAPYADASGAVAYMQALSEREVDPPSHAARRAGRTAAEVRALRGDLDAILCKALDRDPALRYQSAAEFKADLQRYLEQRPVRARIPSAAYRMNRFVRRHALATALVSLLLISLVGGGLFTGLQMHRAALARDMAARRGDFLVSVIKSADPREGRRDITVAELLDSAAATLDEKFGSDPLVEASMLGMIADTNGGLGRYAEGLAASARQLALLRAHGGTAVEISRALLSRGDLLLTSGKYAASKPVFTEVLTRLRPIAGAEFDYATALYELGRAYANTGDEQEAEKLFRDAFSRLQRGSDEQRRTAGYPLENLAVLLGNEGRYAESAAAAREALALQREYLSADHPDLLVAEGNYAMALSNLHQSAEAEPLLRDLVARGARVRGPDHLQTLVTQVQLGEVLTDLKRFDEATGLLRSAAESLDRVAGSGNLYALRAWIDYALAACNNGDAAAGLVAARQAEGAQVKLLQGNDWHAANGDAAIGLCLVRLQRLAEAEPILVKAAADLEASRGPGFYRTQQAYQTLREVYVATDRAAEAQRITDKLQQH